MACLLLTILFWPWGLIAWLIYPLQMLRQTIRNRGPWKQRLILALFQLLARFAEGTGQVKFLRDRAFGRQAVLIEYK
jgi:hypothetical protein